MTHVATRRIALTLLAVVAAGAPMAARAAQSPANQAPRTTTVLQGRGTQPVESAVPVRVDDENARSTRDRLHRLLQQYPPSVGQVLRLDPSLLKDQTYLASYPTLAAFLAQHPEVAHNPAFFVGEVRPGSWEPEDPRTEAIRMWRNMMQGLTVFAVVLTIIGTLAWVLRTVIDHRRWLRLTKIQTDAHTKLLDRFSSNEDMLAYIQTPAGRRFLESAPIQIDAGPRAIGAPLGRILWSVQAGLVLAFAGVGLQFVGRRVAEEVAPQFFVMGVLALSLGVGFVLSAVVAYVLSRRLGLFEPPGASMSETSTPPVAR